MAAVTLRTLWLNDADDLSDFQAFPLMNGLSLSPQQDVTIGKYAGGRLRVSRMPGTAQQASVTLPTCTPDQREWVEAKIGALLCVRDDRGRKFYAVYANPQITEHPYDGNCDITLTLSEATHSEAA